MENLVQRLFYNTSYIKKNGWNCNVYPVMGKHYLEKHSGHYLSTDDFEKLMEKMGYKARERDGRYYLRPRKQYVMCWA